jgi:hypothetical protein
MKIFKNNDTLESKRVFKQFLNVSFGSWCGMFLGKKTAAKFATLQRQFLLDVKNLLAANLDDIEISDWSLDYSDGEQRNVNYFTESTEDEKLERISLLSNQALCRATLLEDVFKFADYSESREICKPKEANQ